MMSAGMKPWLVKGGAAREAALERLRRGFAEFRRAEWVFSAVWGSCCSGSVWCGSWGRTLPVDTMVWLGSVIFVLAMGPAFVVGGALAAAPMAGMVAAEAQRETEQNSSLAGSTHG
jgi:hypothetical protein